MRQSKNILTDKEMELVSLLVKDCQSTGAYFGGVRVLPHIRVSGIKIKS